MKHTVVRNISGLTIALVIAFTSMFVYGAVSDRYSIFQRVATLEQSLLLTPITTQSYEKK